MPDCTKHWGFIHPFQLRLQRGIEVYVWNLSAALARRGIQVDIITWDGPLPIPDWVRQAGVKVITIPKVRYFESCWAVPFYFFQLLRHSYDHIFIHFAGYGEGAALQLAHYFRPIPFSIVFHFPPSLVPHRFREYQNWRFDRAADHLIAVSQATANEVIAWSGREVDIIGHGVDAQQYQPDAALREQTRLELDIPMDAVVLITVAALEERKGCQWVLPAMTGNPSTYYLVIGDGPYMNSLKELTSQLDLENRVKFLGFQLEIKPYLAASDIGLLLSYGEAFGLVLLEYAAMELPIITSSHPPFPELVNPSWGLLVDKQNTDQVSNTISRLEQDVTTRKKMGLLARDWAIKENSWQKVANEYIGLVEG